MYLTRQISNHFKRSLQFSDDNTFKRTLVSFLIYDKVFPTSVISIRDY